MKKAFAFAFLMLCASAANALPLAWRADWPDCRPVEKLVHRGTDVELQPTWYVNGAAADTNGWTLSTYVQTNCVGAWFGPIPGARFAHSNDVGAASYGVMVRAEDSSGGVNYTAFARLRMLDSPGYSPGELPLPAKVIDFADVTVLNPPWPTNDVAGVPGNYAAVSNAAMNALSRAEAAAGFTEWGYDPPTINGKVCSVIFDEELPGWVLYLDDEPTSDVLHFAEDETELVFDDNYSVFATRTRLPTMADMIGKASTNDVVLTPAYSATFSEWRYQDPQGVDITAEVNAIGGLVYYPNSDPPGWYLEYDTIGYVGDYPQDATLIPWGDPDTYTATRTRTDSLIGYTLGSQTDKPLASTNALSAVRSVADAAASTNAAQTAALESQALQLSQQSQSIAAMPQLATNAAEFAVASADTSYRRVIGVTNLNQSVQYVSVTDTEPTTLAIDLPAGTNTADWIVYVTSVTNVTLSLPAATWWMADTAYTNDIAPATPTALFFSQVTDGVYLLGRQELEPVTITE